LSAAEWGFPTRRNGKDAASASGCLTLYSLNTHLQGAFSAQSPVAARGGLASFPSNEPSDFSNELNRLMYPYWRKARIDARLLIKREDGKPWSARDRRLAEKFVNDPSVINRLVDQAMNSLRAMKKYGSSILGWFN
jgi:hypothetical protein